MFNFDKSNEILTREIPYKIIGKVRGNIGELFEVNLPHATLGGKVIFTSEGGAKFEGEIISIKRDHCLVMLYENCSGISSRTLVEQIENVDEIKISENFLGRILDFKGLPIDGKGDIEGPFISCPTFGRPHNPLNRPPIKKALDTGIKAINSFITLGKGQRMGIMAGSGVGKSVLLGMMARSTKADVNVIALIGERGREVLEFIENDLGEEGLKKSIIIVATSDCSPLVRIKAAYAAISIAEFFQNKNKDVLLMMDSITRFAMAYREITLASGEPPTQKGYSPGVFSKLPKLLERVGTKKNAGSITGIFTVLVEGDDVDDPIADAVRSIVDGHIVLSRKLANKNHYPAIDILASVSRVMQQVVSNEHRIVASHLRDLLASYYEQEDLINLGAYSHGSSIKVDKAILVYDRIIELLKQQIQESSTIEDVYDKMVEIAKVAENYQSNL